MVGTQRISFLSNVAYPIEAYLIRFLFSMYFCDAGKVHVRNTAEQLKLVGPRSLGVSLLTAGFVGMVFTIQVCTSINSSMHHLSIVTTE